MRTAISHDDEQVTLGPSRKTVIVYSLVGLILVCWGAFWISGVVIRWHLAYNDPWWMSTLLLVQGTFPLYLGIHGLSRWSMRLTIGPRCLEFRDRRSPFLTVRKIVIPWDRVRTVVTQESEEGIVPVCVAVVDSLRLRSFTKFASPQRAMPIIGRYLPPEKIKDIKDWQPGRR
jgi:hypothetical protein